MSKINISKSTDIDAIRAARQIDLYQAGKSAPQKTEDKSPIAEDKVNVSNRAAEVGKLVDDIKQFPDVRQDLVNELKVQVSAGEYNPTSDEIAAGILKDEGRG
jgi:negative regulator of flagellin synthesis FlgM